MTLQARITRVGFLLLALLAAVGPAAAQETVELRVAPASSLVPAGGEIQVAIEVAAVAELDGFDVTVVFDPAVVAVVDADPVMEGVQVIPGSFLEMGAGVVNTVDNPGGTVQFAVTQPEGSLPKSGTGTLILITLRGVTAGATTSITIDKARLVQRDGTELPASLFAGEVIVLEAGATATPPPTTAMPTATPLPTATPTPPPSSPPPTTLPGATATPPPTTLPGATATPPPTTLPGATVVPESTTTPGATAAPPPTTAGYPPPATPPGATVTPPPTTLPGATVTPASATLPPTARTPLPSAVPTAWPATALPTVPAAVTVTSGAKRSTPATATPAETAVPPGATPGPTRAGLSGPVILALAGGGVLLGLCLLFTLVTAIATAVAVRARRRRARGRQS